MSDAGEFGAPAITSGAVTKRVDRLVHQGLVERTVIALEKQVPYRVRPLLGASVSP